MFKNKLKGARILDVGCGNGKYPNSEGMDIIKLDAVDHVHDMNVFPWPFEDNSFDSIYMSHVIEHCDSILKTMEEVYRILKPGGLVYLITPHYTDAISWQDITHKWHLNTRSFRYFDPTYHTNYYTKARFNQIDTYVEISKFFRIFGFEVAVNLQRKSRTFRSFRSFWEQNLCFIVRGKNMHFLLEKPQ